VSPQYHVSADQDDEAPVNKVDNIFDELEKLKAASLKPETFQHELQDEILKEVFDKRVVQMLDTDLNQERIRQIFLDFDFNRVKEYPLPMMIIILKEEDTAQRFKDFLFAMENLTTRDVDLILTYLCQIDFQDGSLVSKLEKYPPMNGIMETFQKRSLSSNKPGYYALSDSKALKLASMSHVIEQIRHRTLHEKTHSYSVALNHLLNEIHAVCYKLDNSADGKNYKASHVVEFLNSQNVPPRVCISIRNLFDRRNINKISHPGSEENLTWSVERDEYLDYRSQVGRCLEALL
jgi:AbiA family abortive infection protein